MEEFLGVTIADWIGYLASITLLISFMMKDVKKLRVINSIGCALFVIFGLMIKGYPIVITNVAIVLINFYYLFIKKN